MNKFNGQRLIILCTNDNSKYFCVLEHDMNLDSYSLDIYN